MKNSLLDILKSELKFDFTQTLIHNTGGVGYFLDDFEFSPRDFLKYAKSDYSEYYDNRGLINSLTNSKRAIDCQIDYAFTHYGIKYNDLNNAANDLIKIRKDIELTLPFKLKLISALDSAPSVLVSKVRELRNKLEHNYKKPNKEDVKESIELAELFILAVEGKTKSIGQFILTDTNNYKRLDEENSCVNLYQKALSISLTDEKKIHICKIENETYNLIEDIDETSSEFYFLIRIINNLDDKWGCKDALIDFLKYLKHPIPERNINLICE